MRGLFIIVLVILIFYYQATRTERYTDKREKAGAIVGWFDKNPRPRYSKYRADLGRTSNAVEYEDALAARAAGMLTVDGLAKML